MSKIAGYFLVLDASRSRLLENLEYETFAEPVTEFSHSRNIPLICFILNEDRITHVGLGSRGVTAGTSLRKLNVNDIVKLSKALSANEIVNEVNSKFKQYLNNSIEHGGLIPPRSFEEFLQVLLRKRPELQSTFEKYTSARRKRIERLSKSVKKSLAEQKEAVLTALNIAGISKSEAKGWDYSEGAEPTSFLDGLEQTYLREDSMIFNDLTTFPGFDIIKTTKFSSSVFENRDTKLTVLLANKLPLEELLGTDLIYFNENFKCFIMVQYKAMEKESERPVFRLPNKQLTEEIQRMEKIASILNPIKGSDHIDDFRISAAPFFIKFCPRLEFNPDNVGLSTGMYVPLEYLKMLQLDKSIIGAKGGKAISFDNVGRYFDNTSFKTIIEGGWIGTYTNQSSVLEKLIKDILKNGKTAVIAIKKSISEKEKSNEGAVSNDFSGNNDVPF